MKISVEGRTALPTRPSAGVAGLTGEPGANWVHLPRR